MKTSPFLIAAVLMASALAPAPLRATSWSSTTVADFNAGSSDGEVDVVGTGGGAVRLAKLAGTLGAFQSVTPLAGTQTFYMPYTYGNRVYLLGGFLNGSLDASIYSNDVDASGNFSAAWTLRGSMPGIHAVAGVARWMDKLYLGGGDTGASFSNIVRMATLDSTGMPGSWTTVSNLPLSDIEGHLIAAQGRLIYFAGNTSGLYAHSEVYSAPILGDGTLGSWVSEASRPVGMRLFCASYIGDRAILVGGEDSSYAGSNSVVGSSISTQGVPGAWSAGTSLTQPRSYFADSEGDAAGKLFILGGKTYPPATSYATVYSAPVSALGVVGAWTTEASLPQPRMQAAWLALGGKMHYFGGSDYGTGLANATVFSASLNQGAANAAVGSFAGHFDLGSVQSLGALEWTSNAPANVQLQVRVGDNSGVFSPWSSLSSSGSINLPGAGLPNGRYVEYRARLTDNGSGNVELYDVTLRGLADLSTPTASPTPTATTGPACSNLIFQENFESFAVGTTPTAWAAYAQSGFSAWLSTLATGAPGGIVGQSLWLQSDEFDHWVIAAPTAASLQNLADLSIEAKASGGANLMARAHDTGSGLWNGSSGCSDCYVFGAYGDTGTLNLFKMVGGTYIQLSNGGNSYPFGPWPVGATITARLDIVGDHLQGYANGILVVDLHDSSHSSGAVGLFAMGAQGYDDFKVWSCAAAGSPTPSPTPSPIFTATPSPVTGASVCSSYGSSVVAFYGGNSPNQLKDSVGSNDLTAVGTVPNGGGGQPEGDAWLGTFFSGTGTLAWLNIPGAVWPGATGAIEFKMKFIPGSPNTAIKIDKGVNDYLSLNFDSSNFGFDLVQGGALTAAPYTNAGLVSGQTYAIRLEWGAFGIRAKVNGTVYASTPLIFGWASITDINIGVFPGFALRDLVSPIDALAVLNDPIGVSCLAFSSGSATPSPTVTFSPTLGSATPSPTFTRSATPSASFTRTATPSFTVTRTPTASPTRTRTASPSATATASATPSPSPVAGTLTNSPTSSPTPSPGSPVATLLATATATGQDETPPVYCPYRKPGDEGPQKIVIHSKAGGRCSVRIYRPEGRPCKQLWEGNLAADERKVLLWADDDDGGQHVASGIYLVVFRDGNSDQYRNKIVIIR